MARCEQVAMHTDHLDTVAEASHFVQVAKYLVQLPNSF